MKTKILVAIIACLALGACSKQENGKDTRGGAEQTQQGAGAEHSQPGTTPSPTAPAAPGSEGHTMNEDGNTNLAIDDTTNQAQPTAASSQDNKSMDMNTSNTNQDAHNNQDPSNMDADQHNHPED